MQLNQTTDYAFRVILHLACTAEGEIASGVTIAEKQSIPPGFLQKVMRLLTKAGIVQSYRGAGGGFTLARKAADISLLDVVVAMEGPLGIHRCLLERSACNRHCTSDCPVHEALDEIQNCLVAELAAVKFAALAAAAVTKSTAASYI